MASKLTVGRSIATVLFWSLVSAAFIGPGTVTTASKAGANFGLALLWALVFSTIATIVLQEAAARLTISSGRSLGEIISLKYQASTGEGLKMVLFLAVAFGCAAYQAANLLGAMKGLDLLTDVNNKLILLGIGVLAGLILLIGNISIIGRLLGVVVALMGVLFIVVATQVEVPFYEILESALLPTVPQNSMLLIISLVGTTIVPYNLFLASGVTAGQNVQEMRLGLIVAVLIGGLISMAILVVGTEVKGEFSFENLATALVNKTNTPAMGILFSLGLFAAGISSAITAPLATAITAQSLFKNSSQDWSSKSLRFRMVWLSILLIGLSFALLDIKPIPAIIIAQAINGVLLPIVAIFLLLIINDRSLFTDGYTNTLLSNIFMWIVVGIACFLGSYNVCRAVLATVSNNITDFTVIIVSLGVTIPVLIWLFWRIFISQR